MSGEVGIKIEEFRANISNLRSAVSNIENSIKTDSEFDKTNIEPFTKDLEATIDAITLLARYKQMLNTDIDILESVGNEMVENDNELSKVCEVP